MLRESSNGLKQYHCPRCNTPTWPRHKEGLPPECGKCRLSMGIVCECEHTLDDRWGTNYCEGCGEVVPIDAYCKCDSDKIILHPGYSNPAPLGGKQMTAEEYNQVNRCGRCKCIC